MRDSGGTVTIFFAIWTVVVFGLAAVGVDGGYWYVMRRQVQNAADAAAIAGVASLAWNEANGTADTTPAVQQMVNAGLTLAADNGIGGAATVVINGFSSADGITATANPGPTMGPYAAGSGDAATAQYASDAVEAIIRQPASGLLSTLVENLAGIHPPTVAARAVALYGKGKGKVCTLALAGPVTFWGNATVDAPNCVVASNDAGSDAIGSGGSASLSAYSLTAVGLISVGSGVALTAPATPNQPPTADPFVAANGYIFPTTPAQSVSGTTLNPGYYDSSISLKGAYTFNPGLYVINGDFGANAGANASCNGCTFVLLNGGAFKFNGGATLNFTASSNVMDNSGNTYPALDGVIFYEQPGVNTTYIKFNGNSTLNLQGVMYFPNGSITIQGNNFSNEAIQNSCFAFVANDITFTGNNTTNMDASACSNYGVNSLNTRYIQLVE